MSAQHLRFDGLRMKLDWCRIIGHELAYEHTNAEVEQSFDDLAISSFIPWIADVVTASHANILQDVDIFPDNMRLALAPRPRASPNRHIVASRAKARITLPDSVRCPLPVAVIVALSCVGTIREGKEASESFHERLTKGREAGCDYADVGLDYGLYSSLYWPHWITVSTPH